jgi:glutamine amidotransferase
MLAHNGTVGAFEAIRGRLLETMAPAPRAAIRGDTDSKHLFQFLLSLREREAGAPLVEVLDLGLQRISDWSARRTRTPSWL